MMTKNNTLVSTHKTPNFGCLTLLCQHNSVLQFKAITIALFLLMFSVTVDADDIEQQRELFVQALASLEAGDRETFLTLAEQNKDYILYPYLEYYDLRSRLETVDDKEIVSFIDANNDLPISWYLRNRWLFELAESNRWDKYYENYNGQRNARLKCNYLQASLQIDQSKKNQKKVFKAAKKLWMVGKKQPQECDPLFQKLHSKGQITPKMLWERIELAMKKGNLKLASELSQPFNKRDKALVDAWKKTYRNPEKGLKMRQMRRNHVITRKIAYQAIQKIAGRDAEKAKKLWGKAARRYGFDKTVRMEMNRYIALQAAYQYHPLALNWLNAIPKKYVNSNVRVWKVRTALKAQDWPQLAKAIDKLTDAEKSKSEWRYWYARAQESLGKQSLAEKAYDEIALKTNYYGFLSADKLNRPYTFNAEPLQRNDKVISELLTVPAIQRTKELYLVGRVSDARREWNVAIGKLKEDEIKSAAILAHEWQWYDNAILTVARTGHRSDLDLRFPTPYKEVIFLNAQTYNIDPSWIYGVTRRESAFNVIARSNAGALGLMQLMPGTARWQSKKLGLDRPSINEILTLDQNILLGSAYLNQMLTKFSGNQVLATAAYNAGPNRVLKWLPDEGSSVAADVWVDTLPYKETREYVRAVMAYATIFDWKLKEQITPLKERMHLISKPLNLANSLKSY